MSRKRTDVLTARIIALRYHFVLVKVIDAAAGALRVVKRHIRALHRCGSGRVVEIGEADHPRVPEFGRWRRDPRPPQSRVVVAGS